MAGPRSDVVRCDNCRKKNRVPVAASGTPKCANCGAPLPWATDAGDGDFDQVALASPLPVIVDLWAEWCGPCRMVSPALDQVAHEMAGRVKLVKVDVDKAPATAARFQAMSIPTLLVIDHGHVVSRQVGAVPAAALRSWVEGALAGAR